MTQTDLDFKAAQAQQPYFSKIIDAHLHLPVDHEGFPAKREALLAQLRENGVSAGVVIADSELVSEIGSTEDCVGLFAGCPNISVVGGISPFLDYARQLQRLELHLRRKEAVGIKIYCGHEPVFLNCAELEPVFSLAKRYHVPVLFHSGWENAQYGAPQIVRMVSKANPAVKLVCCHCWYPRLSECFSTLEDCGNVFFDISSVADDPMVRNGLKGELETAIRAMPDRFLFGSDFGSCDQTAHLQYAMELALSEIEREKLFYKNAAGLYRLYAD